MPTDSNHADIQHSIDAVWRIESARLIAALTRIVRDVGLAEDLAQDALVTALERWPRTGIPDNPGAWLMAAAKNRAIDLLRRNKLLDRKHQQLGYELESSHQLTPDQINAAIDDPVGDDLLRLIFISCHPILAPEARVALTLRLLGGLTTDEIARAFLLAEPTVAQRIVRAKRTLGDAHIPFEVPRGEEFTARLSSVLQVVYLIFNEGYSATAGDDWTRPALCEDALRLGRILSELVPDESEVHGLVALMEIQASRLNARIGPTGEPILLLDQDRSRWDQILIHRGLTALKRAEHLLQTNTATTSGGGTDTGAPHLDSEMWVSSGDPSESRNDTSRHKTKVGSHNPRASHLNSASPGAPSSARGDASRHETKVGSQDPRASNLNSGTSASPGAPSSARGDSNRHKTKVGSQDPRASHPDSGTSASPGAPSSARGDASRHETKVGSQDASIASHTPGPYTLQAAIAACHARALTAEATDWHRIAALYAQLLRLTPSPIIQLNRAVAVSMASGPAAALPIIDALADEPTLRSYHLLPSVRGDLLHKLGRHQEARTEFERAAALTRNARERTLLLNRAKAAEPAP